MLLAPRLATTTRQHTDRQPTRIHAIKRAVGCPATSLVLLAPVVPLVPLDSREPRRSIFPHGVHPASIQRRPAAAPATGCSEGVIAPAACPATRPALPAAKKPQSRPQLTTCRPAGDGAAGCVRSSIHQVVRRRYETSGWHSHQRVTTNLRAAGAAAAPPRRAPRARDGYVSMDEDIAPGLPRRPPGRRGGGYCCRMVGSDPLVARPAAGFVAAATT